MRRVVTDTLRWLLLAGEMLCVIPMANAGILDFEDLGQGPNAYVNGGHYWNGPDLNGTDAPDPWGGSLPVKIGSFQSGGVSFSNRYNTNYGSWSGFAWSNTTDTTTVGNTNQYSAYTGSGHGPGSDNYCVGYGYADYLEPGDVGALDELPHIELPSGVQIQNAYVTNTTYAALSMLQGDQFAKKFGGPSGADPDWFKLTVYGTDLAGDILPTTVDLYLADYRNLGGTPDHIVSEWTLLDLSPLAGADRLYFNVTSSDVGLFGMNTPAYFAIDNISLTAVPEPSTFALLCGVGVAGTLWGCRRRFLSGITAQA